MCRSISVSRFDDRGCVPTIVCCDSPQRWRRNLHISRGSRRAKGRSRLFVRTIFGKSKLAESFPWKFMAKPIQQRRCKLDHVFTALHGIEAYVATLFDLAAKPHAPH